MSSSSDCGDFRGDPERRVRFFDTTQHISTHPAKKFKTEGLQGFCPIFNPLAGGLE